MRRALGEGGHPLDKTQYPAWNRPPHGLDDRYEVLSTIAGEPGEVMQWCETRIFCKAEAVFEFLEPHCTRLGYANLALRDRWTGQIVRSAD